MKSFAKIRHILFFIFIAAIAASLLSYSSFGREFNIEEIRIFTHSLGIWLPISFIIGYAAISVFLPTTPLMALSGIIFGFGWGLLYTVIGGFISAFITFYLARILGRDFVEKLLHKKFMAKIENYDEKIARHGFSTVIILRMIPIMPFNVLNLLMGISKVTSKDYALGTLVGLAPSNLLTVYFGGVIFSLVSNRIVSLVLGLLFLILLVFIAYKYKEKFKKILINP